MANKVSLGEVQQVTREAEQKYGLPDGTLFKISGIESSHGKNLVSPKGAKGWFQFIDATAKAYGLDDPMDLAKSADAAGRYMRDNLQRYNGNIDLALADYNGGPKAAKALAQGKPWGETADYLSKFHGETPRPLSNQFTTGERIEPTASASASELYQQRKQQESEYGGVVNNLANLPSAIGKGFEADNSVYNWWKNRALESVDPNFTWTDDIAKRMTDGINQDHWDYVLQAKSAQEAQLRRGRVMEAMEREQELARMGVAGFAGRLTASLADLPTLISFVPFVGGTGALTTTSRIANAARMGLIGAGTNVAFDAVANQYKPLATHDDLYISAVMGLALGGAGGAAVNPKALARMRLLEEENRRLQEFGRREAGKAQIKEIEDNGFKFTPKGEDFKKNVLENPPPPPKEPGISIIHPTGEGPDAPPKIFGPERPIDGGPAETPRITEPAPKHVEPPPETPKTPRDKPWGEEWDKPKFMRKADVGDKDLLVLPKMQRVSELADYVRSFSQNTELVTVMNRVLKGIDLRKLEFKVLEQGEKFGHRDMDSALMSTRGVVGTPWKSAGDGIKMFLRGHSWADNGMNEETFVHELVHAAAVYKQNTAQSIGSSGMKVSPEVAKANQGMADLFKLVEDHSKNTFGDGWKKELNGRLGVNMQNEKEMLAYGLTNKNFQDYLKSVPLQGGPDKTLWDRFVSSLRKLLGIGSKEHNALSSLIELSAPLTQKGGVERVKADLVDAHGVVDADTVEAANAAGLSPVFGIGLGMEHRLGSAKVPASVRELASKLFGSTVGYKNHSVVKANAWDDTVKLADGWIVSVRKEGHAAFNDWFKEKQLPWSKKSEAWEDFGTKVSNYIRGVEGEYPEQVKRAGEAMRKKLAEVVDHINNPSLDEGGIKKGLTMTVVRDPNTGGITLVGGLDKNPNYLPRKHDINKWNSMVNNYGRDAIEGWWARAYQKGRPEVTDAEAAKWSKWYVRTVEEAHANRSQDSLEELMRGHDKEALKYSLIHNGGFSEAEAKKIMEGMFPTKATDSGRLMSSLKHRNTIDETHVETWKSKSGDTVQIGLNDFINSNAFDVVEPYLRRTASSVSLAKHLDVYKMGDIARLIEEATHNKLGNEFMHKVDVDRYRKDLKFAFERIQGMPQEEFTGLNKSLEMWRNFNVIRLMGGAVWNQLNELAQITGSMGWKATLAAIPELRALKRDIATGKAPHDFLDHLENTIGGAGSEYVARVDFKASDDWVRHKGDTKFNQWLDKTDNALKKGASAVLDYTGMTPLMVQQKRIHAIALVNHWINHAHGKIESKLLNPERLAWMGMDEAQAKDVFNALKTYATPKDGQFSKTFKIDVDRWIKESPETHSRFMTAIHRETRRVVQENDLASMIPIMGTTLGQTMFQFMSFTMQGWNKQLMYSLNHRDMVSAMSLSHGLMIAAVTYWGRTMAESMGKSSDERQKFMEDRLNGKQWLSNTVGRVAQASMLPNLFDTVSPVPLFSGMRTTSDVSSIASNPTLSTINTLISMKKLVVNAASSEQQTTEADVKQWLRLVPLNNTVGISNIYNMLASEFPQAANE